MSACVPPAVRAFSAPVAPSSPAGVASGCGQPGEAAGVSEGCPKRRGARLFFGRKVKTATDLAMSRVFLGFRSQVGGSIREFLLRLAPESSSAGKVNIFLYDSAALKLLLFAELMGPGNFYDAVDAGTGLVLATAGSEASGTE